MTIPRAAAGLALLYAAGCAEPTQLVVWIDSDLPPSRMDRVDVEVSGPEGVAYRDTLPADLPASFGVKPRDDRPGRLVTVTVSAVRHGRTVLRTAAATTFVENRRMRLDLFLSHLCLGVTCEEDSTCRLGSCEPTRIDRRDLVQWGRAPDPADAAVLVDASAPDAASPDAGPTDAGPTDAGPADAGPTDAGPDGAPCVACDPLDDRLCPNDEMCRFYSADCNRCERPGPVGTGDACTDEPECGRDLGCARRGPTGTCQRYCASSASCSGGTDVCATLGPLGLCSGGCDPLGRWAPCPPETQCLVLTAVLQEGGSATATFCATPGPRQEGEACTLAQECGAGMECMVVEGQNDGTCRRFCAVSSDCDALPCAMFVTVADVPLDVGLCTADCDPIGLTGCPAGQVCRIVAVEAPGGGTAGALACGLPGLAAVGSACTEQECEGGAVCYLGFCRAICETGALDACVGAGGSCLPLADPVIVNGHEFGYCG